MGGGARQQPPSASNRGSASRDQQHVPALVGPALDSLGLLELPAVAEGADDEASVEFQQAGERPPIQENSGVFRLYMQAEASLGTSTLRECVKLPWGVGRNEWIACQALAIFEEARILVCLLLDLCRPERCTCMRAGPDVIYEWRSDDGRTVRLTAIAYMMRLITWAHKIIRDQEVIPLDGREFPACFMDKMKNVARRLFRIYAHTYIHHFRQIRGYGAEAHLNCLFKHYLFFVWEFDLVQERDMAPLLDLVHKFKRQAQEEEACAATQPVRPSQRNVDEYLAHVQAQQRRARGA